jgi:phytoene dehydrogenase-like protein
VNGDYDVAVVGAGPNGLTAAAYLARSGARVAVLEARFERGGTMTSDDYSTPFTYNQAQAALPLGADNPVVAELGLAEHGVAFVEPAVAASVLTSDGELAIGRGGEGLGDTVQAMFAAIERACGPALYRAPVPEASLVAGWRSSAGEAAAADLADLTPDELGALATSEPGRLALRYACAASGFGDPGEPIGAVGGFMVARWFSPALVAGGSKNLPNALFRLAASAGADGQVSARVTRVRRDGPGFRLSCRDGREIGARGVICTLDPRTTFTGLLDPALVPAELAGAGRDWAFDDLACFTAHFGIAGQPPVSLFGDEPYLRLVGFGSAGDLDDHLAAVRAGRLPSRPAGLLSVTTAHDPLQASPGPYGPLHTLRFDTFAPLNHPDGPWDRERRAYRARCWEFLCEQLPALREAQLIAQFADAPGDLRRRFGTTGAGSARQGALGPAQALTLRPHPLCADTRTPVDGFYLGGGGVHPGVPGLLAAGMLAARALMAA